MLLVFLLLFSCSVFAQSSSDSWQQKNNLVWGLQIGGPGYDFCQKLVVSSNSTTGKDDIFLTGNVGIPAVFGGSNVSLTTPVTNGPYASMFVAKYSDSTLQWIKHINSTGYIIPQDIALTADGANVIVTGTFTGLTSLNSSLLARSSYDAFTAMFSASTGDLSWIRSYDSNGGNDFGTAIAAGGADNSVLVSVSASCSDGLYPEFQYTSHVSFARWKFLCTSSNAIILIKYDVNGNRLWTKTWNGASQATVAGMATHPSSSSLFLVGGFQGTISFGSTAFTYSTTAGEIYVFVVKVSQSDGSTQWVQTAGGAASQVQNQALDLAVSSDGLYVTGYYESDATFNGTRVAVTNFDANIFLAKYALDTGVLQWVRVEGSSGTDEHGNAVKVASDGSVFLYGKMFQSSKIGTYWNVQTLNNLYLAKYSSSGNFIWVKSITINANTEEVYATSMGIASDDSVYMMGFSSVGLTIGTATNHVSFTNRGSQDIFLVKFGPCMNCSLGTYNPDGCAATQQQCLPCPINTFADVIGLTSCLPCPETKVSNANSAFCRYDSPGNIIVSNIGSTIFNVSWNRPIGWNGQPVDPSSALNYAIFLRNSTMSPWTAYKIITDGTITSFQFELMNANSSYQVAVQAVDPSDDKSQSPISSSPLFYTKDYSPPAAVSDLRVVTIYKDMISIMWSPLNDLELAGGAPVLYDAYFFVYDATNNLLSYPLVWQNYRNGAVIYNLLAGTTYRIAIAIQNAVGLQSTLSNMLEASTIAIPSIDSKSISFPSVGTDYFYISFPIVPSATSYVLYLHGNSTSQDKPEEATLTIFAAEALQMPVLISSNISSNGSISLQSGHQYLVSLEVYEGALHSLRSDQVSILMKPASPTLSVAQQATVDSITLDIAMPQVGPNVQANGTVIYKRKADSVWNSLDVTQATVLLLGLSPGTRYLINSYVSATDTFETRVSDLLDDVETCTALDAVDGLSFDEIGEEQARAFWSIPVFLDAPPESYLVSLDETDTSPSVSTTSTQYNLFNLKSSNKYKVDVRAVNCQGSVQGLPASSWIVTKPKPPSNLQATSHNESSIYLSWVAPFVGNVAISSYTVQYSAIASSQAMRKVVVEAAEPLVLLSDLMPGSVYNIRISAMNVVGLESNFTDSVRVVTFPAAPIITNFTQANQNNVTVVMHLGPNSSPLLQIRMKVVLADGNVSPSPASITVIFDLSSYVESAGSMEVIVSDLTVGMRYYITAAVSNIAGFSAESEGIFVTTEDSTASINSNGDVGPIVGGVVGGVAALVLLGVLAMLIVLAMVVIIRKKSLTSSSSSSGKTDVTSMSTELDEVTRQKANFPGNSSVVVDAMKLSYALSEG